MNKKTLALDKVYGLLEPGPVVLLTTAYKGQQNVMTMSWHTMLDFEPPLIGCVVSNRNHSFDMLKHSKQCAINIPSVEIADKVVACGNSSGRKINKFEVFDLTPEPASDVIAPLIAQCFANLECRVVDTGMVAKYCLFVLQVTRAWVDRLAKKPKTIHHLGFERFMIAGDTIKLRSRMR